MEGLVYYQPVLDLRQPARSWSFCGLRLARLTITRAVGRKHCQAVIDGCTGRQLIAVGVWDQSSACMLQVW